MNKLFKLSKNQREEIEEKLKILLQSKKEIIFTYIHGSFLLDLPFHDIDLAIFVNENAVNELNCLDYEIQLSIELELVVKIPIDVKIINFAPLPFKYNITKGNLLFCKDNKLRLKFIETTWMEYLDFQPYYLQTFKYLFNIK